MDYVTLCKLYIGPLPGNELIGQPFGQADDSQDRRPGQGLGKDAGIADVQTADRGF